MLLAIDTSAGTSVAVVNGATGISVERSVADTRRHAEVIGTLIQECLSEAGTSATALSGVAIGMGPGPFTGLRVGIAAAIAFSIGARITLLRVGSHDSIAFDYYRRGGIGPLFVTTDARRHELYWTAYRGADALFLPERAAGPSLDRPDDLEHRVTGLSGYTRRDTEWLSAASVGSLAETLVAHGRELASAEPLYLRSPDVTLPSAPKRVSS